MRVRRVKSNNPAQSCPSGTCSTQTKRRPGKYDSLGICPRCANKAGNKVIRRQRNGNTIKTKVRCGKCGVNFDLFRVIGTKMNIKSVS